MKFSLYLLLDYITHGLWPFLLALPQAVIGYIVVHAIAKVVERKLKALYHDADPIVRQPIIHAFRHRGKLADCTNGLCKVL